MAPNGTEDVGFTKRDVKSDNPAAANDTVIAKGELDVKIEAQDYIQVVIQVQGHSRSYYLEKYGKTSQRG